MIRKLLTLAVTGCLFFAGLWLYLNHWSLKARVLPQPVTVELPRGGSLEQLASQLHNAQVISDPTIFRYWLRLVGGFRNFQAGPYRFADQVKPEDIRSAMIAGNIYEPVVLEFTIPEGFTVAQIVGRLSKLKVGSSQELMAVLTDPKWQQELKVVGPKAEGYLYPATYQFTNMPGPRRALTRLVKTFWSKLPPNYEASAVAKGLTLHEAITFASLIEMETKVDDERPLVSEVIWARLEDRAPLGIDATIIYGIKNYDGDLKWRHLRDSKNLYNSRIHRGLPPTPIGAPSRASMEAVLEPSSFGYYYYVLKPGSDRHHFSKSLAEHNKHVKKLVRAERQR